MAMDLAKKDLTHAERFTAKIMAEFAAGVGDLALTQFQKRLIGNYFIALDASLKGAEEKRLKKSEKFRDATPIVWSNLNMQKLAQDVVACARIGFDPAQRNHIHMVPYKNNTTGLYDIAFIEGYRGLQLKAEKYGLHVPDAVIVEVVYSTDKFHSIKRDTRNPVETYTFEITNDFDRGAIVGGFYYHIYADRPDRNKLVVMSLKDIEKRKPPYASVEFWGGEKPVYKDGKKTGETETVEGWHERMVWKTLYRAAYSDITIDSQRIDDDYLRLSQMEAELTDAKIAEDIAQNANKTLIDIEATDVSDVSEPQPADAPDEPSHGRTSSPRPDAMPATAQGDLLEGPGF